VKPVAHSSFASARKLGSQILLRLQQVRNIPFLAASVSISFRRLLTPREDTQPSFGGAAGNV
jgi:hypothetical protein